MLSEFEETHNSNNAEELQLGRWAEGGEQKIGVESQSGDDVNDGDGHPEVFALVRTGNEPDQDLECEPDVADRLDYQKGRVGFAVWFVHADRLWLILESYPPPNSTSTAFNLFSTETSQFISQNKHKNKSTFETWQFIPS